MDADLLIRASDKADELQDIRFFFDRYQGLRNEDYFGLRWSDIDMSEEVIYLRRYDWQGQRRNLKPKEGGERTIPIHSGFHWRIRQYLPMAVTKTGNIQIWKDDYKSKLKCWGSRWAKCLKDRYGFGSHDLRSHVVTKMMKSNINPFFLHAITGHRMPGTSSVLLSYVKPTVSEVRNVLKLLK